MCKHGEMQLRIQNILRGLIKHGEIEAQQNLYLKSVVHLYLMYLKWGTIEVHKRGLTHFLDDLGIMHLMYVYIHEKSEIKTHNMLILNFDLWWPLTASSDH